MWAGRRSIAHFRDKDDLLVIGLADLRESLRQRLPELGTGGQGREDTSQDRAPNPFSLSLVSSNMPRATATCTGRWSGTGAAS